MTTLVVGWMFAVMGSPIVQLGPYVSKEECQAARVEIIPFRSKGVLSCFQVIIPPYNSK